MWTKRKETGALAPKDLHLYQLGVSSTDEINAWYKKSYQGGYKLKGLSEFTNLIHGFRQSPIYVFGDYDVDGVTATTIMLYTLRWAGCTDVHFRIPHRISEGFGLNTRMIDEVTDPANSLIITVDNGIAAIDAVKYAKEKGCTVIVTDHHQASVDESGKEVYPEADLLIDPSAIPGTADFSGYCGAGIAYKIAESLLPKDKLQWLQPLAAVATIADVMELREENHVIVRNGLKRLSLGQGPKGLIALARRMRMAVLPEGTSPELAGNYQVEATNVAFSIAPAINAAGRLMDAGADIPVKLFLSQDKTAIDAMVEELVSINEMRKLSVEEVCREAERRIKEKEDEVPMVLYQPGIPEGVVGIIAGKLSEKYHRPALVFTDAEDCCKGSGRSVDGIDLKILLDECQEYFVRYGGHAGAAGMSVEKDTLPAMTKALQKAFQELYPGYKPVGNEQREYDAEIKASDVPELLKLQQSFEPTGEGNRKPVYKITGVVLQPQFGGFVKTLGTNKGVKLLARNFSALSFSPECVAKLVNKCPASVTIYGTLAYNYFNGQVTVQVEMIDAEDSANEISRNPISDLL